jgi:hypothetical protein
LVYRVEYVFYLLFHLFLQKSKTLIVQWFFKSLFFKFLTRNYFILDFLPKGLAGRDFFLLFTCSYLFLRGFVLYFI